jgi:hypothetical protein
MNSWQRDAGRSRDDASRVPATGAHPANPDLLDVNRTLVAGRPLQEQFRVQADGERLGAATWRSFAKHAGTPAARDALLACALLEEESAAFLESILDAR